MRVLIAGPTAGGKSAMALRLAERSGAWIVNADSMQVYADLAILSARPTRDEEAKVPHRLYGFVDGATEYSVGAYLADVRGLLAAAEAAQVPLVFVGGTGLYFRALTEGLVQTPAVPVEIRTHWERAAAEGADLHAELFRRDPGAARRLNPADVPRLLRALEVVDATGVPLDVWRRTAQGAPLLAPGTWRGIVLAPARDTVRAAIARRFHLMVEQGALDEAARIAALALPDNRGVMKAHGLKHLIAHRAGAISLDTAIAAGIEDTQRYARRQITWARKFMADWHWAADADAALAVPEARDGAVR